MSVEKRIEELVLKIELLQNNQQQLSRELHYLNLELQTIRKELSFNESFDIQEEQSTYKIEQPVAITEIEATTSIQPIDAQSSTVRKATSNNAVEDFIGTNLISKVGILITIIGVFIGAKYAIDKELISPIMRIILGYLAGGALIITAVKLKGKFENYSAVLMGGGLAVLYFLTYVSYNYYALFPQALSFVLMLAITATAVFISLWYNQKIIAILGLVASYAIPFLLSNGSGRVSVLFTYVSIINIGLLILSFRKNWKVLYRLAFFLTWLIYFAVIIVNPPVSLDARTAFLFLSITFFTFYSTFLSYKIVRKELYNIYEVALLLWNALLYFFIACYLINENYPDTHALTYFTIANAIIHLAVGYSVYRLKLADFSVYQFIIGLGLLFITIAIPIELNGSWVTILWTIEATILCWVGLKNNRSLFLTIAAPMIIVAAISLLQDWFYFYTYLSEDILDRKQQAASPFLNLTFWFSLFVSCCFGYITKQYSDNSVEAKPRVQDFYKIYLPLLFLGVLYFTFLNEIIYVWDLKIAHTINLSPVQDESYKYLKQLSWFIYSFLFFSIALFVNDRYVKSKSIAVLLRGIGTFFLVAFLMKGFWAIGELRVNYFALRASAKNPTEWMIIIRYACFLSVGLLLVSAWQTLKEQIKNEFENRIFIALFNLTVLISICNEFVHWMDLGGFKNQYKLGVTIICALYALVLIIAGIKNRKRDFRIGAIVLFAFTLLKLFFYDLQTLSAISKTLVLVILGIILLVISFLYNKYKHIILEEDKVT